MGGYRGGKGGIPRFQDRPLERPSKGRRPLRRGAGQLVPGQPTGGTDVALLFLLGEGEGEGGLDRREGSKKRSKRGRKACKEKSEVGGGERRGKSTGK